MGEGPAGERKGGCLIDSRPFHILIIPHPRGNLKTVISRAFVLPYVHYVCAGGAFLLPNAHDLALESRHLDRVLSIARAELCAAERSAGRRHQDLVRSREELRDQSEQSFANLWGSDDFEALLNLNQLAAPLSVAQQTHEMELSRIQSLVRMLDTPYFARLDIRYDDGGDEERAYIGRATLKDSQTHEIHVLDWRSPIASVFYRFGIGPAHYDAPGGRVDVQVQKKRQYEIHGGTLEYFFDADVQVQDEFLRKLLAKSASPRMKAIVETIQRDQDAAIRDTEHELLMVQGAAGSGKTSIALHRAAYLMYDGLASRLSANNILILSPNALFERYIERVLPELGERSVRTATFEALTQPLTGWPVLSRAARFEALCLSDATDRVLLREAIQFKESSVFITILDRFCAALPRRYIPFQDVVYAGQTLTTRQQLKQRILHAERVVPLSAQLRRMESSLWDGIRQRRPARMAHLLELARKNPAHALELIPFARACSILESAQLSRHIRSFTRLDCRALYKALVSDEARFRQLAEGLDLPKSLPDILAKTRASLDAGGSLSPEDACCVAYLRALTHGPGRAEDIRQVVVDEAQDYGPLQFAVLNRLYPRARFTVLGDVSQSLDRPAAPDLYAQIAATLGRKSSALVTLNKSFRCTREILAFSLRCLGPGADIESFSRSGDEPLVVQDASVDRIAEEIARCREKGDRSIALIVKTARDAARWGARLGLPVIDGSRDPSGAFVIPLALSKGLEFDAALVLDADADHYGEMQDRHLLYVACTRALHHLALFYQGDVSPLLGRS